MRPTGSTAVVIFVAAALGGCGADDGAADADRDHAIAAAERAYEAAKRSGDDLTAGPCLLDSIPGLPDWVADVAHDPRRPVDNDPENQCSRYRAGEASHFVELAPDGSVIRAE